PFPGWVAAPGGLGSAARPEGGDAAPQILEAAAPEPLPIAMTGSAPRHGKRRGMVRGEPLAAEPAQPFRLDRFYPAWMRLGVPASVARAAGAMPRSRASKRAAPEPPPM